MFSKQILQQLFSMAKDIPFSVIYWDGSIDSYGQGPPRFEIALHDEQLIEQLGDDYEVGFADAYMDGRIDINGDVGEVISVASRVLQKLESSPSDAIWKIFRRVTAGTGRRSLKRQRLDVQHHYDLGNDFYRLWLDRTLSYSCAYFKKEDDSLEAAQVQKIDHSLNKLRLVPGESLLDIGCGWGALIRRAAQKYDARSLGITLSREQYSYSCDALHADGLADRCDVRLQDYQTTARQGVRFDKIASIGMIEHVGKAHLDGFSGSVSRLLKPGGLALLHFITSPKEGPLCTWMDRYIFPGAYLPTIGEMVNHFGEHDLRILDIENLRPHYQMTLDHWSSAFEQHSEQIEAMYGQQFVRMWRLYLRGCSVSFREGVVELHQVLVSNGVPTSLPLTRDDLYVRS